MEAERRQVVIETIGAGDDACSSIRPRASRSASLRTGGRCSAAYPSTSTAAAAPAVPATIFHRERVERFAGLVSSCTSDEKRSLAL